MAMVFSPQAPATFARSPPTHRAVATPNHETIVNSSQPLLNSCAYRAAATAGGILLIIHISMKGNAHDQQNALPASTAPRPSWLPAVPGFIGSHTCVELLEQNYNVVILDDLSNSWRYCRSTAFATFRRQRRPAEVRRGFHPRPRSMRTRFLRKRHRRHHPFRRLQSCGRIHAEAARILLEQRCRFAGALRRGPQPRRKEHHLLFVRDGLR